MEEGREEFKTEELSATDLETLATIQDELDAFTASEGPKVEVEDEVPYEIQSPTFRAEPEVPSSSPTTQQEERQQIRILNPDGSIASVMANQNIRILNPDGSITSLDSQQQEQIGMSPQIHIINPDGTPVDSRPSTQPSIKILSSEGSQQQTPAQIRIVNSGNIRVVSANPQQQAPQQQIKVIKAGPGTSHKLTLTQAQEMGLVVTSPIKTTRVIKSPVKPIASKPPPKTVVIGSPQKQQQVIIQSGTQGQQIIHLPSSSGNLQMGNSKVQYVRVLGSSTDKLMTVKSGTPILPSTVKTSSTSIPVSIKPASSSVKIALPPAQSNQKIPTAKRIILPTTTVKSSTSTSVLLDSKPIFLPTSTASDSNNISMVEDEEKHDSSFRDKVSSYLPTSSLPLVASSMSSLESSGVKPRKPCNCSKSQCLKLYCDCFANGEFCFNCNCLNCFNNIAHEEDRQKSIKSCLERNPNAFRPKISRIANDGERRHHKGCNCKRSGCLKNYCECYEAKIPCTDACRCMACKNVEDADLFSEPAASLPDPPIKTEIQFPEDVNSVQVEVANPIVPLVAQPAPISFKTEIKPSLKSKLVPFATTDTFKNCGKQSFNFVTQEVIGATCQCLLAQAEEAEKNNLNEPEIEALILEEFGRCLKQIIEISNRKKFD